jgi:DNA/RNA endonuclease YhcR with UshA esterase domain
MKNQIKSLFVIGFLLISLSANYAQKIYTPAEAKDHVDETVIIKGVVDQVSTTKGGQIYFNMGGKYPNNTFSAVILKNNTSKFENIQSYEGKTVEITGKIKMYNNKPEILLEKKEQLKLVPEAEKKN